MEAEEFSAWHREISIYSPGWADAAVWRLQMPQGAHPNVPSAPIPPPEGSDEITKPLQGLKEGLRRELNCPFKCQEFLASVSGAGLSCSQRAVHWEHDSFLLVCIRSLSFATHTEVSFWSVWVRKLVRKGESKPEVAWLACRNMLYSSAALFALLEIPFSAGISHPSHQYCLCKSWKDNPWS